MTNVFDGIKQGVQSALKAAGSGDGRIDMDAVADQLAHMIDAGELPTAGEVEGVFEKKARPRKSKSKLDIRDTKRDMVYASFYRYLRDWSKEKDECPEYGSTERDPYLSCIWMTEPILAGAVYSMAAKMTSLKWQITGRRNLSIQGANVLTNAAHMGGYGWGGFNSSSAVDFYTTDRPVFWEVARTGGKYGRMAELGYIDCLQCTLTGNSREPMEYLSEITGQSVRFKPWEFVQFTSLVSGREKYFGIGFCAVSRAMRAAKLLIGLHDYDAEKLSNLPPEGVAAVTGLTMDEFNDAIELWRAARRKEGSLTFPQVLWLIGSQPNAQVAINFVGFSQLPESFDRKDVVTQYVNTLALDFGVDAREFWPVSSGALGTAGETEVQHMKARGKGPGEYITLTERVINNELPSGVEFGYDTQDIEEDRIAADVAGAWVKAFLPLTTAGGAAEDVISKDQLLRLLADKGVIPDWMVSDERVIVDDLGVHEKEWTHDDVIIIEWDRGILKQKPLPMYTLSRGSRKRLDGLPYADVLKGGPGSGHRGHAGRPGERGGSAPGVGGVSGERAAQIATALKRMMPYSNRSKLNIPDSGLPDAHTKHGDEIDTISYDPDTGTLIAGGGGELHADLIAEHSETMRYDNYVKIIYNSHVSPPSLMIDVSRVTADDATDAWNKGFDTAWALGRVGFSDDMVVLLDAPDSKRHKLVLGEMKEYYEKHLQPSSTWESADAAAEFLKQAEATLEPERNIQGKPIPEDEALRGAAVTQSAIETELELWRSHPELSKYLPEGEITLESGR